MILPGMQEAFMTEKKTWLVDVPVQFNIWIRPECQRRQWEVIKEVRPSILFVVSDGGRNEEEWSLIRQNREMIDTEIDWECDVHRLYSDKNNGMYQNMKAAYEYIWDRVDRCIFMEDDNVPSKSFFTFCRDLLEKYKDDTRISLISGLNLLGDYDRPSADYFFSRSCHVWGFATWKRVYQNYYNFNYGKDPYIMDLLHKDLGNNSSMRRIMDAYAVQEYYQGHIAFDEFFLEFSFYAYHQLAIIPTKNLVSNIGATEDSAHFTKLEDQPKEMQEIFNMKTHEYTGELKHPEYIVPDYYYDRRVHEIYADIGWPKIKRQIERKYIYIKSGKNILEGAKRILKRRAARNREFEK